MIKQAVILAGGKGTRLQSLTKDIPKPMIPLNGKPILEYQVELCARYGLEKITLIVNHLKDPIIGYFGNGSRFGIAIDYFEEISPLGTVGGIKEIEESLNEDFLVLYGDVMMEMDLNRFYHFHKDNGSMATLVVHPNDHPYDSDLLETDEQGRVVAFHSKPHTEGVRYHNMVNAAAYILNPEILDYLEKGLKADFGKDIFPSLVGKVPMYGYLTTEYLKDMGTPGRLEKVTGDILSGKVKNRSLEKKQKAIFLDRDGVINYDTDLINRPEDFELYDFASRSIQKINRSEYLCIVCTNQSVIARGMTDLSGLGEIHKKMEWQLGEKGAYVDAIYFCPHHPDSGYPGEVKEYKVVCECRKPKPGMLLQAAEKFNIDLAQSFFIGDSERDVQAGIAAGVTTFGVKTGHGLKKTETSPDYFMENLEECVDLILENPYDTLYRQVKEKYTGHPGESFVIAVGGNARSGKSTLVSGLRQKFLKDGISVMTINLDDWILPKEKRENEKDVFHNFRVHEIEKDLEKILKGEEVRVSGYARHPQRKAMASTYSWRGEKVVLLDGIVALSTEGLRRLSHLKLFKDISPGDLYTRLRSFYAWKGYSPDAFEKLYQKRKRDEYDIIDKDRIFADLLLNRL